MTLSDGWRQNEKGNEYMIARTWLLVFAVALPQSIAQAADLPSFDVISVKPNKSADGATMANFPLGPWDVYVTNGGYFRASGFPLVTYISFAWKIIGNDMRRCSRCLPTASPGRARHLRLRWERASVLCSGHSTRLRKTVRCNRWGAGGRVAG